ncbi:hypothetical protein DL98DRAFT_596044 [Cadophora sp. DSE1049]|nr:hypothetical protein DL98DRAFT_596044 [Cadophora sp. DSE1049]
MSLQMTHNTMKNQPSNIVDGEEEEDEDEYIQLDHGVVLKSSIHGRPAKRRRSNKTRAPTTSFQGFPWSRHSDTSIVAFSPAASCPPPTTNTPSTGVSATVTRQPYARNAAGVYPCPQCPKTYESSSSVSRHVKTIHDQVKEKRDTCGQTFADKRRRDGHQKNPKKGKCHLDWQRGRYPNHPDYATWKASRRPGQIGYVVPGLVVPSARDQNPQNSQSMVQPSCSPTGLSSASNYNPYQAHRNSFRNSFENAGNVDTLAGQVQTHTSTVQPQQLDRSLLATLSLRVPSDGASVYRDHVKYRSHQNEAENTHHATGPQSPWKNFPFSFHHPVPISRHSSQNDFIPVAYQSHNTGSSSSGRPARYSPGN